VVVGPYRKPEEAEQAFEALGRKETLVNPGVFTELVDRPHGQLEALGSKTGMHVRNEGVLWFVAGGDSRCRWRPRARRKGHHKVSAPILARST